MLFNFQGAACCPPRRWQLVYIIISATACQVIFCGIFEKVPFFYAKSILPILFNVCYTVDTFAWQEHIRFLQTEMLPDIVRRVDRPACLPLRTSSGGISAAQKLRRTFRRGKIRWWQGREPQEYLRISRFYDAVSADFHRWKSVCVLVKRRYGFCQKRAFPADRDKRALTCKYTEFIQNLYEAREFAWFSRFLSDMSIKRHGFRHIFHAKQMTKS